MIQNTSTSYLHVPWLVIVNPQAANGKMQKMWPKLKENITALLPKAEFQVSSAPGAATSLVALAVNQGIRHILAVGGDGTAHQVVNAIMEQRVVPSTEIVFALLPSGSGNDWIKSHGIPRAWDAWQTYFLNGKMHYQNLGLIEYAIGGEKHRRYFMNVAGLAYDAFVVQFLQDQKSTLPPKLYYFWATFRCLFQYTPQRGQLHYNGHLVNEAFYTINVGVCKYSGGGMQFVPHADPTGEQLALTYVKKVSRLAVILNSFRFYGGLIANYRHAVLDQTLQISIAPQAGDHILIEADGEFLGESPLRISLVTKALCFIGK